LRIKAIRKIDSASKRYDIEVADNHNFYANGILVHNSLGILFLDNEGMIRITTRGSLQSEQAQWATAWLNANVSKEDGSYDALRFVIDGMGLTPHVEIIYDENRIVIPYPYEGLCALVMVERSTGRVLGLDECGELFPSCCTHAERHAVASMGALMYVAKTLPWNHEGWVVRWSDGTMAKVKGADYLRIHRIRFGLSPKRIHESLLEGLDPTCVEGYPDEFMTELRTTRDAILSETEKALRLVEACMQQAALLPTRKDQALLAKQLLSSDMTGAFFALLDGDPTRARKLCMLRINPDALART